MNIKSHKSFLAKYIRTYYKNRYTLNVIKHLKHEHFSMKLRTVIENDDNWNNLWLNNGIGMWFVYCVIQIQIFFLDSVLFLAMTMANLKKAFSNA